MTETSTTDGARRTVLVVMLVSLFAGLGMAFAAAATIVATNGPQDESAVVDGQQAILPPDQLLNYGG